MEKEEIDRWLAAFVANPAEVMDVIPEKRGHARTRFDQATLRSGDDILAHDSVRAALRCEDPTGGEFTVADLIAGKAPIERDDRAEDVVDELRYQRASDIDAAGLQKAELAETPWSDDYWPMARGILGRRYADRAFPNTDDWKANYDYVTRRPASKVVAEGKQDAIDALSPSEKYDLLVGDEAFTLTGEMWAEGRRIYARKKKVEIWMGICHGWAPASYMVRRPRRTVTVKTPSGLTLVFFPSDIKALTSLLWANAGPPARFIGTRCDEKKPKKDDNGRVHLQSAFDNNPGTWHLAVVNQIGVSRRALVMDTAYDYEVWNQPVCGYEVRYFNPQAMRFSATAREALVPRGAFTRDRFARYRSKDFDAVVGVAMRVRYVNETTPSHAPTDSPAQDETTQVDYYYDLELDASGRILGGEWYVNRHPDFLWTPAPGRRAWTPADSFVSGEWAEAEPIPSDFRDAAIRGSASAQPLAKMVETLIVRASKE